MHGPMIAVAVGAQDYLGETMFRFVICVDVEASSLEEGYSKLYDTMGKVDAEKFQWESSDEAYTPDGDRVSEDDLTRARMKKLAPAEEAGDRCTECGLGLNLHMRTKCWPCIDRELMEKP